jgi:hypothetical protein
MRTQTMLADDDDRRPAWKGESPGGFLALLALEPEIGGAVRHLLDTLRDTMAPRMLELIALRTSARLNSSYAWRGHVFISLDVFLTMREIACIAADGSAFVGRESATLRAVDELLRDERLSDRTRRELGPDASRVTIATSAYQLVSRLSSGMAPEPGIEVDVRLASPLRARVTYAALTRDIEADIADRPAAA